jgi:hypothetical protein
VVPPKFCCSITAENGIYYRTRIIQELSKYKQVDSIEVVRSIIPTGEKSQNSGEPCSREFIQALSQYKFVVCFESSIEGLYITEKIIQVFLAGVIPIYFGTTIHTSIFNRSSYLYLEKDTTTEYTSLVRRIVYLDKHDSQYIEMTNQTVFPDLDVVDELREQYGIDNVAQHINDRIATLAKT